MRSRWLSSFTLIGALLIILGIIGLCLGARFVFDPGQPLGQKEPWCYLAIGILMVLNGLLTPVAEEKAAPDMKAEGREPAASAKNGALSDTKRPKVIATAVDKGGE